MIKVIFRLPAPLALAALLAACGPAESPEPPAARPLAPQAPHAQAPEVEGDHARAPAREYPEEQLACGSDEDCACGAHKATGEPFYGNKAFVKEGPEFRKFCFGEDANLGILCLESVCTQVHGE